MQDNWESIRFDIKGSLRGKGIASAIGRLRITNIRANELDNTNEPWQPWHYSESLQELVDSMVDTPPDFAKAIEDNFWKLV